MKAPPRDFIITTVAFISLVLIGFITNVDLLKKGTNNSSTIATEQKLQRVTVIIDYSGKINKPPETKIITASQGESAWDALQKAVGRENIQYQDYGGELGIFISGINNIIPPGNKFWLFKVNGQGASVGVSSYKVQNGDKIEFTISEPTENQ